MELVTSSYILGKCILLCLDYLQVITREREQEIINNYIQLKNKLGHKFQSHSPRCHRVKKVFKFQAFLSFPDICLLVMSCCVISHSFTGWWAQLELLMLWLSSGSWGWSYWKTWAELDVQYGSSCGLFMWHGLLTDWWLDSELKGSKNSRQMLQDFQPWKSCSIHLPLVMKDSPDKGGAWGMVNWRPSLETSYHSLLPFLLWMERTIRSQKEKERVRIQLHVAGNGARMLRFAVLVPEGILFMPSWNMTMVIMSRVEIFSFILIP